MSTIVPPTRFAQAQEAARLSRVDGCPEACGNYTLPQRIRPALPSGFQADYRCEDCRHHWTTHWADDRVEWML